MTRTCYHSQALCEKIAYALYAPVAQLDRVPGYEPVGRTFESCQACHGNPCTRMDAGTSLTEGYRSGHNGAVLKTVRVQAHKSSNLLPSANKNKSEPHRYRCGVRICCLLGITQKIPDTCLSCRGFTPYFTILGAVG